MPTSTHFEPELFHFLRQLRSNNRREWFVANKGRYERFVRDPMLGFIAEFAPRLARISPHFVADPRPVGGSLFRIYRDTRFSKDKSPYKTAAAAHFRHEDGGNVHAPGFYLHLEPGNVFAGAGLWHPPSATLTLVRDAITSDTLGWSRILNSPTFKRHLSLTGDVLKRPPRGYDADHPLVEDLKRKDFVVVSTLTEAEACRPEFLRTFTRFCRRASRFVEFLTRAAGLSF